MIKFVNVNSCTRNLCFSFRPILFCWIAKKPQPTVPRLKKHFSSFPSLYLSLPLFCISYLLCLILALSCLIGPSRTSMPFASYRSVISFFPHTPIYIISSFYFHFDYGKEYLCVWKSTLLSLYISISPHLVRSLAPSLSLSTHQHPIIYYIYLFLCRLNWACSSWSAPPSSSLHFHPTPLKNIII